MSSKHFLSQTGQINMGGFAQFQPSAALNRFLDRLPPEVADSFSKEQLIAIQELLQRQQHAIDIRFTLPLVWPKIYCVLLVGPERRSAARRQSEQATYTVWTTANILFITGFVSLALLGLIGLFNLKASTFERLSHPDEHPTSIPFIGNQADCEKSGRSWQDGACIDYEHSPTF